METITAMERIECDQKDRPKVGLAGCVNLETFDVGEGGKGKKQERL